MGSHGIFTKTCELVCHRQGERFKAEAGGVEERLSCLDVDMKGNAEG